MKALSIRQPWAWLIVNGFKDVENRSWATHFRGRILVHAGGKLDANIAMIKRENWEKFHLVFPNPEDLPTGGIVGEVEIVDCLPVKKCPSAWASGPWCWVLRNGRPLPFKPFKGRLSFFEVP